MVMTSSVFRHRHYVDSSVRSSCPINHRTSRHSDFGNHLGTGAGIGAGFSPHQHRVLPNSRAGISVKGINGVVLRGNNEQVVYAIAGAQPHWTRTEARRPPYRQPGRNRFSRRSRNRRYSESEPSRSGSAQYARCRCGRSGYPCLQLRRPPSASPGCWLRFPPNCSPPL